MTCKVQPFRVCAASVRTPVGHFTAASQRVPSYSSRIPEVLDSFAIQPSRGTIGSGFRRPIACSHLATMRYISSSHQFARHPSSTVGVCLKVLIPSPPGNVLTRVLGQKTRLPYLTKRSNFERRSLGHTLSMRQTRTALNQQEWCLHTKWLEMICLRFKELMHLSLREYAQQQRDTFGRRDAAVVCKAGWQSMSLTFSRDSASNLMRTSRARRNRFSSGVSRASASAASLASSAAFRSRLEAALLPAPVLPPSSSSDSESSSASSAFPSPHARAD